MYVLVSWMLFRKISTHAPRTGSDSTFPAFNAVSVYFNPRSPHGERLEHPPAYGVDCRFQPTLPARGATGIAGLLRVHFCISTHAPRTGSDDQEQPSGGNSDDFNPRSPHGERQGLMDQKQAILLFQPTLPARGATASIQQVSVIICISTHAPRTGSDKRLTRYLRLLTFQPTLPARGATRCPRSWPPGRTFQPTLPARGATRRPVATRPRHRISTHAPRTGSDLVVMVCLFSAGSHFNPRSPHGERLASERVDGKLILFQPTLPARGATSGHLVAQREINAFQPTLPARGATSGRPRRTLATRFQPTLPARGATSYGARLLRRERISTHAPRTGSDNAAELGRHEEDHFNPRSPHGERRGWTLWGLLDGLFQPTLPARGATPSRRRRRRSRTISTHAPRTGSDRSSQPSPFPLHNFNPRSPHGERPAAYDRMEAEVVFQPTLPARGATATGFGIHC